MDAVRAGLTHIADFNEGLRSQYPYSSRVQLIAVLAVLQATYLHLCVRRLAPGSRALLAVVPLLLVNVWAPTVFSSRSELLTRVILALLLFWLGNFKAIGLCLNRGPIACSKWNLFQVCLLYSFPIFPTQDGPVKKGRLTDSAGPTGKLFRLAAAHAVALAVCAYMLAELALPVFVKHYIYALGLCCFISFIMNGPAAVLTSLAELDVVPPFDSPWFATSLADFWSRRWNNTVSLTLRSLIYDPIVEGCWIHKAQPAPQAAAGAAAGADAAGRTDATPQKQQQHQQQKEQPKQPHKPHRVHPLRRLAGTAATFAVSGLMHEFMLLYALHEDNTYPAGFWFMFFFCQAPLLVLEDIARRKMRKTHVHLPWLLRIVLFDITLWTTGYFFWYPPVESHTDLAERVVSSVNDSAAGAVRVMHALLQQLGLQQAGGAAFASSVSQATL